MCKGGNNCGQGWEGNCTRTSKESVTSQEALSLRAKAPGYRTPLGAPGLCLARSKSAATPAHSYIILEARFPQQRQGVSNLFQETIADCSSSLLCEGQPPVITLSDPAQLLAPLKGVAVLLTKASPTGNVAAFEYPEGLWRAGLRSVWGSPGRLIGTGRWLLPGALCGFPVWGK